MVIENSEGVGVGGIKPKVFKESMKGWGGSNPTAICGEKMEIFWNNKMNIKMTSPSTFLSIAVQTEQRIFMYMQDGLANWEE